MTTSTSTRQLNGAYSVVLARCEDARTRHPNSKLSPVTGLSVKAKESKTVFSATRHTEGRTGSSPAVLQSPSSLSSTATTPPKKQRMIILEGTVLTCTGCSNVQVSEWAARCAMALSDKSC